MFGIEDAPVRDIVPVFVVLPFFLGLFIYGWGGAFAFVFIAYLIFIVLSIEIDEI